MKIYKTSSTESAGTSKPGRLCSPPRQERGLLRRAMAGRQGGRPTSRSLLTFKASPGASAAHWGFPPEGPTF